MSYLHSCPFDHLQCSHHCMYRYRNHLYSHKQHLYHREVCHQYIHSHLHMHMERQTKHERALAHTCMQVCTVSIWQVLYAYCKYYKYTCGAELCDYNAFAH